MRGVGGPLLCISDLLSDVGEESSGGPHDHASPPDAADFSKLPASEIPKLFQENFNELKGALEGDDHSWTALTLKVEELERIVTRRDSAIAEAKAIQDSPRV
ncbi:uncharacterized protein LOC125185286 isoform X2 [Salvia hispanica]|uniref:uncharacterized protein LOC125185286 isoform X2 n=1 Tax=Salvia hispanica TaxID=49212 RepID=UPI0020099F02|nr:uncharacterized protein LOC125185286 isoform X2 [Salvia hispanica]XP_047937761.1 uncharacterized protein LOC125185286 isoform X2 [Salvia hispanica]